MKTVFLRALEDDDKAAALLAAIQEPVAARRHRRFEADAATFAAVPRSPFAYWVSDGLRRLFTELPPVEAKGRAARQGGVNGNDFRWLRLWTEAVSTEAVARCVPIAKGGKYSPFYADLPLQALWDPTRDTFWAFTGLPHRPSLQPASFDFYFRPALTWPRRTQGGLSLRAMPAGCIFADKGPALFVENDAGDALLAMLAIVNASVFRTLVDMQMAFGSYEVGVVQRTPMPNLAPSEQSALATLARRAWSLKRGLDTRTEGSHAFTLPALLQVAGDTLSARANAWAERASAVGAELTAIQAEIDARCFTLYGIDDADRRAISEGFGSFVDQSGELIDSERKSDADTDEEEDLEGGSDATDLAAELVSWAAGVAFGRFDLRLGTGERQLPAEPEPFDPLPMCSPAMLTDQDGSPVASGAGTYPFVFPENGILVEDAGHARDITAAVRSVFNATFGDGADAWWNEVVALLDPRDHDLRSWIGSSFFEHHLKRHSKSRRKAPILWRLSTQSGRYGVWLYALRLTRDSFFQLQNDVVAPKVAHEERLLNDLVQAAGESPPARERKEINAQAVFVEELRTLLDEIKRVAPLWNPMLADGVALTMAPLWRLVPHHKPWQKELKGKWAELVDANYEWAQTAMHLWPERVVPKCATDRSLAIAHGLEDIFWTERDGKWKQRSAPLRPLEDLVRERSSAAVKAALKSLLDAPVTTAGGGRGRVRRVITGDAKGAP